MSNKIKAISYEQREAAFWFLVGVSVLSLFIYFYAINAIARNTAIRQNLEAHVADAAGRIGGLEFAYIGEQNKITAEVARSFGFSEVKSPLYVSRTAGRALTFNR